MQTSSPVTAAFALTTRFTCAEQTNTAQQQSWRPDKRKQLPRKSARSTTKYITTCTNSSTSTSTSSAARPHPSTQTSRKTSSKDCIITVTLSKRRKTPSNSFSVKSATLSLPIGTFPAPVHTAVSKTQREINAINAANSSTPSSSRSPNANFARRPQKSRRRATVTWTCPSCNQNSKNGSRPPLRKEAGLKTQYRLHGRGAIRDWSHVALLETWSGERQCHYQDGTRKSCMCGSMRLLDIHPLPTTSLRSGRSGGKTRRMFSYFSSWPRITSPSTLSSSRRRLLARERTGRSCTTSIRASI